MFNIIKFLFGSNQEDKPVFVQEKKPPKEEIDHAAPKITASAPSELGTTVVTNASSAKIWEYPFLSLLNDYQIPEGRTQEEIKKTAAIIEQTFKLFGVESRVIEISSPIFNEQYLLETSITSDKSKCLNLVEEIAFVLDVPSNKLRIYEQNDLITIDLPTDQSIHPSLKLMLSTDIMQSNSSKLTIPLGLNSGRPAIANIPEMPHLLLTGTSEPGVSNFIHVIISTLLFRASPDEVKLILVDPKRVELIGYNGIPHLLVPVIVDVDKILSSLKWAIGEMERRYKLFANNNVRNIDSFNELAALQTLPYIVIFIDELADLMSYAPVEVEDSICRLAQMGQHAGIHLVIATLNSQSKIDNFYKRIIPTRISVNKSLRNDETLINEYELLYTPLEQVEPSRIQSTYVSENEIGKLVNFLKNQNPAVQYTEEVSSQPVTLHAQAGQPSSQDQLFEEAIKVVCQYDKASASLLQRRLSIGYARAARILDQLEKANIIGSGEGSKPRDVLVQNADEAFASMHTQHE